MWKGLFALSCFRKPNALLSAINKQSLFIPCSVFIALALFLPVNINAQEDAQSVQEDNDPPLEEFLQKRNEAFREYREKIRRAFSAYRDKAATVWGADEAIVPSREEWVSYCSKMCQRRRVNFKQGFARYEYALDPGQKKISQKVESALIDAIVESITQGPDQRSITRIAEKPNMAEPGGKPLLSGLFAFDSGKKVTGDNARKFARKKVRNHLTKRETKGRDGRKRIIASVTIPMIPDHLRKRAQKYAEVVKKQAERQALSSELVFSIIETESYFNPLARSPTPAFGLMQIVPFTGGREAYRMVYGKDIQPSEDFLYQPRKNVTLGVAYFHRLYFTYMAEIQDEMSRLWCAVASYNIGPINLYRTFSDKGKSAAMRRVNAMDSEEVFNYLVQHLPSRQTREYLREIRRNIPKYESL